MSDADHDERCPFHPHAEPVIVVVDEVRSAQSDHPTRLLWELRCPACP